jgi:hypothetical protein
VRQVRARSLYIQARNTHSSGANLGFAYSEGNSPRCHSRRSSCAIRPTRFAHFTFPSSGTVFRAHPLFP